MHSFPVRRIAITAVVGLAWLGALALGIRSLATYETTPGAVAVTLASWPADSTIPFSSERPTLVMLAHPLCPCTRASMAELARLMAELNGELNAYVLFLKPDGTGEEWDASGLWKRAAAIPGVTAVADPNGVEAWHFGAETSGHTLLFAPDGRLLFSGGITQSRGHEGDNAGKDAIVALVRHQEPPVARTRVFGCALVNSPESRSGTYVLAD